MGVHQGREHWIPKLCTLCKEGASDVNVHWTTPNNSKQSNNGKGFERSINITLIHAVSILVHSNSKFLFWSSSNYWTLTKIEIPTILWSRDRPILSPSNKHSLWIQLLLLAFVWIIFIHQQKHILSNNYFN